MVQKEYGEEDNEPEEHQGKTERIVLIDHSPPWQRKMHHSKSQKRKRAQDNADLTQQNCPTDNCTTPIGSSNLRHGPNNRPIEPIADAGKETTGNDPQFGFATGQLGWRGLNTEWIFFRIQSELLRTKSTNSQIFLN